jgi:crotonobetainyl-CoA:carnitine CoA-transferase CaiB-like acyl-CoA transferase
MDIVRSSDDAAMPREPGGIGDYNTGMQLLGGVFAALYHREKTGQGQLVDASLMRAGVWSMAQPIASLMAGNEYATGKSCTTGDPARWWLRHSTEPGERHTFTTKAPFKCKDGVWMQLLGNDVGPALPKLISAFGLTREALLGTDMKNIDWSAANRTVDGIISQRTFAEWEPILRKHDVWYVKVNKFEDQIDPESPAYHQNKAVGSFVEVPGVSRHELLGIPVKLSAMDALPRAPAPRFGQHTDAILQELGVSSETLAQLKSQGVVGVSKGVRAAAQGPPAAPQTRA